MAKGERNRGRGWGRHESPDTGDWKMRGNAGKNTNLRDVGCRIHFPAQKQRSGKVKNKNVKTHGRYQGVGTLKNESQRGEIYNDGEWGGRKNQKRRTRGARLR